MPDKAPVGDDDANVDTAATAIGRLTTVMAALRDPLSGCPWDVEQSFTTIAPYTIEEAYEVADAIERGDMPGLEEELGDLLLQVVFHARMAEEQGLFSFENVAAGIADKMIRRHPHVFGNVSVADADAQSAAWEALKEQERAAKGGGGVDDDDSALAGLAGNLPALMRALKLQKRAARIGFDWDGPAEVLDKIREEVIEIEDEITAGSPVDRLEDEIGDLLFAVVNLARKTGVDADKALRRGNQKFERRFRAMEDGLKADGLVPADVSLDVQEAYWVRAKRTE